MPSYGGLKISRSQDVKKEKWTKPNNPQLRAPFRSEYYLQHQTEKKLVKD